MWHAKVAKVLRELRKIDEARAEYQAAIDTDEELWLGWGGVAMCDAEKGELKKAIETMNVARAKLEATPGLSLHSAYRFMIINEIGKWQQALGDTDAAVNSFKEAFRKHQGYDATTRLLGILHKQKNYQGLMDFLEELQAQNMPGTEVPRLPVCMADMISSNQQPDYGNLWDVFEDAACATGRLDFLVDIIQQSVDAARKNADLGVAGLLQNWLGSLLQKHVRDEAKAIQLWEQITETSSGSKLVSYLGQARTHASINLAMRYYDKALAAGKGTPECEVYIKKLENLSRYRAVPRDQAELTYFRTTRETTLVLGRLYMLLGEEAEASECFRVLVKLGVDFLSDDSTENDWCGHQKLAHVSLHANDDVHAAAAYSLLGPKERDDGGNGAEEEKTEIDNTTSTPDRKETPSPALEGPVHTTGETTPTADEPGEQPEPDLEGGGSWICNGPCGVTRSKPDGLHACRACLDLYFCDDCVQLVKDDKLPIMLCNPNHDFFQVPTAKKRLPKGMVLFDGREVEIREWIEALTKRWGLVIVKGLLVREE